MKISSLKPNEEAALVADGEESDKEEAELSDEEVGSDNHEEAECGTESDNEEEQSFITDNSDAMYQDDCVLDSASKQKVKKHVKALIGSLVKSFADRENKMEAEFTEKLLQSKVVDRKNKTDPIQLSAAKIKVSIGKKEFLKSLKDAFLVSLVGYQHELGKRYIVLVRFNVTDFTKRFVPSS
jgi:hypothetical protein